MSNGSYEIVVEGGDSYDIVVETSQVGPRGPQGIAGPNTVTEETTTPLQGVLVADGNKVREALPGEVVDASALQAALLSALANYSPTSTYAPIAFSGSASDLSTGTLANARLSSQVVRNDFSYADPAWVTTLSATKLTGSILDARLSSNVPLKNGTNTFTGSNVFNGSLTLPITNANKVLAANASGVVSGVYSVTENAGDSVPGRLLKVGDFGFGRPRSVAWADLTDEGNTYNAQGFSSYFSTQDRPSPHPSYGYAIKVAADVNSYSMLLLPSGFGTRSTTLSVRHRFGTNAAVDQIVYTSANPIAYNTTTSTAGDFLTVSNTGELKRYTGNVISGPSASVNNLLPVFSGTTGGLLSQSKILATTTGDLYAGYENASLSGMSTYIGFHNGPRFRYNGTTDYIGVMAGISGVGKLKAGGLVVGGSYLIEPPVNGIVVSGVSSLGSGVEVPYNSVRGNLIKFGSATNTTGELFHHSYAYGTTDFGTSFLFNATNLHNPTPTVGDLAKRTRTTYLPVRWGYSNHRQSMFEVASAPAGAADSDIALSDWVTRFRVDTAGNTNVHGSLKLFGGVDLTSASSSIAGVGSELRMTNTNAASGAGVRHVLTSDSVSGYLSAYSAATGTGLSSMVLLSSTKGIRIAASHDSITGGSNDIEFSPGGRNWNSVVLPSSGGLNVVRGNLSVNAGYISSGFQSIAGDPTTLDLSAGLSRLVKNTISGEIRHWINDAGVLKKSPAYS